MYKRLEHLWGAMMSQVNDVEMKPGDRIAEAGILLAEQAGMALISDAYRFPQVLSGTIKPEGSDGTLKIEGPVHQLVKTTMKERHDSGSTYFATWTHSQVMDPIGRTLSTKDQVAGGDFLVVLTNNRLGSHTDFKAADGNLKIQMDGQTQLTPKDGVIRDATNTITDAAGNYLGEMRLVARPTQANVLNITASYKFKDTYLGDVELVMTLDPKTQYTSADIQIQQKYNPPPVVPPQAAPAAK